MADEKTGKSSSFAFHATGAHVFRQNSATLARVAEVHADRGCGCLIPAVNLSSVQRALRICDSLPMEEVVFRANDCLADVRENCSLEMFKKRMHEIVQHIISRRQEKL